MRQQLVHNLQIAYFKVSMSYSPFLVSFSRPRPAFDFFGCKTGFHPAHIVAVSLNLTLIIQIFSEKISIKKNIFEQEFYVLEFIFYHSTLALKERRGDARSKLEAGAEFKLLFFGLQRKFLKFLLSHFRSNPPPLCALFKKI